MGQNCYGPQTKCAKVMFLHLSVSHSVHRGGHAWLQEGMCGCEGCMVEEAYVVAGGCAWLQGGVCGWGGLHGWGGGHA